MRALPFHSLTLRILSMAAACLSIAVAQEPADPVFAAWRDKVDPAVENGLRYLSRVQLKDGSFPGPEHSFS